MDEDVTNAEDAFNVALSKCSNEAERQALITETLMTLYGGAADKYAETAGSIMDANKATADYSLNMAALGERMEPITTAVQNGINKILTKFLEMTQNLDMEKVISSISNAFDKFVNDTIPRLLEIIGNVDIQSLVDGITSAFDSFINDTIPKIIEGLKWIKDNKDIIIAGVIGIGTAFAAWKVVGLVTAAISAFTKFKAAIAAGKTVMQALNITMTANPIGIVIALVAGLVAAFIYLWNNCEWFRQFWINLWNGIKEWLSSAATFIGNKMNELSQWLSSVWNGIKTFTMAAVSAVVNLIKSVWGGLVGIVSGIWNGVFTFLQNIWNGIKTTASNFVTGVVNTISNAWNGLKSILIAPFEAVTNTIDNVKNKIGGLVDKIKGVGGKVASAIGLPTFAKGGFTNGVSIAGEAGTEAVISFNPRYRADNLKYWATAGRILGADVSDFTLSGSSSGTHQTIIDSVHFAPNITVTGNAAKQDIIAAIRETYPEFMDLINEILNERNEGVYA